MPGGSFQFDLSKYMKLTVWKASNYYHEELENKLTEKESVRTSISEK